MGSCSRRRRTENLIATNKRRERVSVDCDTAEEGMTKLEVDSFDCVSRS